MLLAVAFTACRESTDPGDPEPEVATIRLTVGANVVSIAENGAVTGGPLRITTTDQVLTADFLRADGTPDPLVTSVAHRLDLAASAGITFTPTSAFMGSIRGATAGTTGTIQVSLFHVEEGHADLGPFPVPVQVD